MLKTADFQSLETEFLERWEGEGGQVIENSELNYGPLLIQLVAIPARKYATSLQWNKSLLIEPFQPGNGILREDRQSKGKI